MNSRLRFLSRRAGELSCSCIVFFMIVGCNRSGSTPPTTKSERRTVISAEKLLTKVRDTYRTANSFADNAVLSQKGVSRVLGTVTEIPFNQMSILFERPNRYVIVYEDAASNTEGRSKYRIACNGEVIRSEANQLPEQIHEAIAPRLATVDNLVPEPELRQAIFQVAMENLFPQLRLLLIGDPEQPIFPRAKGMRLISDGVIDKEAFYRLEFSEPEGNRILWIDKERFHLRRMEIPTESQREQLDPGQQFSSFSVELNFSEVTFDPQIDNTSLSIDVPAAGRLVRRFVSPPPEAPPSSLGKVTDEFEFRSADGSTVTPETVVGKICLFDFWSTNCQPCKQQTPLLEQAYQKFKESDEVVFFSVSTDPDSIDTSTVEKTSRAWGSTIPVLRDLKKSAFDKLGVKYTPTILLMDGKGRLQLNQVGMIRTADELASKIEGLLEGTDLAAAAREEHEQQIKEYEAILDAATINSSLIRSAATQAKVASQELPDQLLAESIWETPTSSIHSPGDIALISDDAGEPREIIILEGGTAVVRLDAKGQEVGRIELPKQQVSSPGFARVAADSKGELWYLVSGVGWQQVHLYDKNWQLAMSFPDVPHSGIGDAQLIATTDKGPLQVLVGYWGGYGLQAGSLDGRRLWVNHQLDHIRQISRGVGSPTHPDTLWCTSTRGNLFSLTGSGASLEERAVVGKTIRFLQLSDEKVAAKSSDTELVACGFSEDGPGQFSAVGFSRLGKVLWSYDLSPGEYPTQFAPIYQFVDQANGIAWLVVGPDSSLHFLSSKGELVDRFDYGEPISGLAVSTSKSGNRLYVSAGLRTTAWNLGGQPTP